MVCPLSELSRALPARATHREPPRPPPRRGRRLPRRVLPASVLGWLLVGLALRQVFLLLTIHADTVAVYYRIGEWRSGSFDL